MERSLSDVPKARRAKKDERDERKGLGWLALLLRGGSSTVGGAGAVDGAVSTAAGSALLATKAAVLAGLAVAAAGVVGGMVFLGYRSARVAALEKLSRERSPLFAPKPAAPASADDDAASASAPDGASSSLSMLVAGNASRGYDSYAHGDVVTASMQPPAAAVAPAGPKNGEDVSGNKAATIRPAVQTVHVEAQAASAAAGVSAASGASPATVLAAISKSLSGAPRAPQALAAFGGQRAIGSRRFGASNALRALGLVRRDQVSAGSSQAAGTTYDGARPAAVSAALQAAIQGASAAPTGAAGAGSSPLGSQASALTPPPPAPSGRNATPWQNAVNTAMMCVLGAAACLMIISRISWNPMLKPVVLILAGVSAMLSTITIAMGSMMASGKYGQTFQGHMFTLAGGLMLAASAAAVMGMPATGGNSVVDPTTGQSHNISAAAAEETGSAALWMVAAGGAALAAAMVGYLSQPKVVNDPYFKGSTPDWDHTGHPTTQYRAPSQDALARFLA